MESLTLDSIIVFLLALLGGGTVITTVFKFFKIPTQIGFILSGILIGPFGLGLIQSNTNTLDVAEIAAVLLMFCLGLEFSITKLKSFKSDFLVLGPLQVTLTIVLVSSITYFFMNQSLIASFLWGMLISLSSTALVFKSLKEAKKDKTIYGSTSIAVLLFQDLAIIPAILFINLIGIKSAGKNLEFNGLNFILNNSLLFLSIYILKRWMIPFSLEKVAKTGSRELFYYSTFLLCFGVSYASHSLGLSYSVGAFIAGLIIAESPYGRHALAEFSSLRDNFLGIFFMSIGMLVSPLFIYHNLPKIIVYVLLIILIKSTVIFALMRIMKKPRNISIIVSMILSQVGEFSFILATLAFEKRIINNSDLQLFISLSIMTLVLTPFLFKYIPKMLDLFGHVSKTGSEVSFNQIADQQTYQDLIIIIGYGHMGQEIVRELRKINTPFKIIEQNHETYSKYKRDLPIFYGNAAHHEVLEQLEVEQAKLVIICINNPSEIDEIISNIKKINPLVKIVIRLNYIIEEKDFNYSDTISFVTAEREVTKNMIYSLREFFQLDNK